MDPKLKAGIIFLSGFATGFVMSRFIYKEKCEEQKEEEIAAMKEFYSENAKKAEAEEEEKKEERKVNTQEKPDLNDYISRVKNSGYSTETKAFASKIIRPDEFGELGYDMVTYKYYADDVLVNDNGEPLTEEEMLGRFGCDVKDEFGEYQDDSVYFRNDALQLDYEILYDPSKFFTK